MKAFDVLAQSVVLAKPSASSDEFTPQSSSQNRRQDAAPGRFKMCIEPLESRYAPATISVLAVGSSGTFTDANGDVITIYVKGTAGQIEFKDAGAGAVDDGDTIA